MVLNLRRPVLVSAGLGVVAMILGAVFGHVVMGILFCIGLVLGVVNARMLQRSVVRVISSENPTKRALTGSSIQRLMVITVLAFALGFFVRPDGLGVFFGLAVFQLVFIAHTTLPVMKGRRKQ
ncbi:MAG: ATP synthase subunit I [Candidatus Dormibacteraceae bacterium]